MVKRTNPYSKHTFIHFAWNVYHLLVYQFGRYAIGAWVILVIVIALVIGKEFQLANKNKTFARQNRHLIEENKHRINEIRKSQIKSCVQTYTSIQEVFEPFYPPKAVRTPAQESAVKKFEGIIASKKTKCRNQARINRRKKP